MTRSGTPTCGAASPTPLALNIVSTMSSIRRRMPSSTRGTRVALVVSTSLWSEVTTIGRTGTPLELRVSSHRGVDVDAPAPSARKVWERPLDGHAPQRQLPAILAPEAVQEGRCRAEDVEPVTAGECTREAIGLPPRLGFAGAVTG